MSDEEMRIGGTTPPNEKPMQAGTADPSTWKAVDYETYQRAYQMGSENTSDNTLTIESNDTADDTAHMERDYVDFEDVRAPEIKSEEEKKEPNKMHEREGGASVEALLSRPESERVAVNPEKAGFIKGRHVSLHKHFIEKGRESGVKRGTVMNGFLEEDVRIGSSMSLEDGSVTTTVREFFEIDGRYFAQTETSLYEVVAEGPPPFRGLELKNEFGEVHTPPGAVIAELGNEVFQREIATPWGKTYSFYINKEKLQGVLLEVNGGQLFRSEDRFMVVCKVGEGHLPFYISSEGTGGKRQGDWYPFFGHSGHWLVKGAITNKGTGDMYYSEEILKVQKLLNENLCFPANLFSIRGRFGFEVDKDNPTEYKDVIIDINSILKYATPCLDEKFARGSATEEVGSFTGYFPRKVKNGDKKGSSDAWISQIVRALG